MKKTVLLVLIGLAGAGLLSARTDTTLIAPTLEKRISALEKIAAGLPEISGFINMRYQYSDADGGSNSFDIRRARLDFKGNMAARLDYRFQVEFAGSVKILDAYVRYKIDPRFNVQAGEFKIPFSLENVYGPTTLETVDNSMAISRLCNYSDVSGISANGRDIGVGFYGGFIRRNGYHIIDYAVGLFNGNGINLSDNNKSKDFSGRLTINPLRYLSFAGSYYNGSYGREGETHGRVRAGAGARWDDRRLLVRSEYIYGKTGGMESEGVYAVAGYFVHPKFQPLLKYDYFQQDKTLAATKENDYTIGLNYYPIKALRLQANYTYKAMGAGLRDINYVAFQFFAVF